MLVYWKEEDCVSVVPLRDIVDPCPLVTNHSCTVQTGKNIYYGLAVQMGTLIVTVYVRTYIHYTVKQCLHGPWVGQMLFRVGLSIGLTFFHI